MEVMEGGVGRGCRGWSAIGGLSTQSNQPPPPPPPLSLLLLCRPPPTLLGGRNTGGRGRVAVGETVKERQETLSCYIITTPGVMCILFKIHVFSPPPTLRGSRVEDETCWFSSDHPSDRARTWYGTRGERGVGVIATSLFSHGPGNLWWPWPPPGWLDFRSAALICTHLGDGLSARLWVFFLPLSIPPPHTLSVSLCICVFPPFPFSPFHTLLATVSPSSI